MYNITWERVSCCQQNVDCCCSWPAGAIEGGLRSSLESQRIFKICFCFVLLYKGFCAKRTNSISLFRPISVLCRIKLNFSRQNCLTWKTSFWNVSVDLSNKQKVPFVLLLLPFAFNHEAWMFFRACLFFKWDSFPEHYIDWTNENVSFGALNNECLPKKRSTFWSRGVQVWQN